MKLSAAVEQVALLDHKVVDWSRVRHTRYWMYQRFQYRYPGRIRELRQRLVVIPGDVYGDQRVQTFELQVSAPDATTSTEQDAFGNRVFLIYVPEIEREVYFEMELVIERDLDTEALPLFSASQVALYLLPTLLTSANPAISAVAEQLARTNPGGEAFAEAAMNWVYGALRYGAGATTVASTAADALAAGQGLCQDYAHLMLALCRAVGVPARYVSGHMLGEGGSHAWVEVLLPTANGAYRGVAFDATNHRRTTPAYITVAAGRDYRDVSPTSGSYLAACQGQLSASKRAGLTYVAYR